VGEAGLKGGVVGWSWLVKVEFCFKEGGGSRSFRGCNRVTKLERPVSRKEGLSGEKNERRGGTRSRTLQTKTFKVIEKELSSTGNLLKGGGVVKKWLRDSVSLGPGILDMGTLRGTKWRATKSKRNTLVRNFWTSVPEEGRRHEMGKKATR